MGNLYPNNSHKKKTNEGNQPDRTAGRTRNRFCPFFKYIDEKTNLACLFLHLGSSVQKSKNLHSADTFFLLTPIANTPTKQTPPLCGHFLWSLDVRY